jgi:Uma2 family endonuclease
VTTVIAVADEPVEHLTLYDVPWSTYEAVSRAFEDRRLRITYDRGTLEIMTVSHGHEFSKRLLGRLIEMLTFVLHIRIHSGGSTTFKRKVLEKGMEPDECYWIQNEPRMRGRSEYDIETDPPPDLGLEIDVTTSSIRRMGIYAALRVPEVWRVKRGSLSVHHLGANGQYKEKNRSRAFPFLPLDEVRRFLNESQTTDETTLLHAFHDWVRDTLLPAHAPAVNKPAKGDKRNGKKNGKKS